jgi:hypothetical protein
VDASSVEWLPVDMDDVVIPLGASADNGRLDEILLGFGMPALVMSSPYSVEDHVCARVMRGEMDQLLGVNAHEGVLVWQPIDEGRLVRALFEQYGPGVVLGVQVISVDGDLVADPSDEDLGPEHVEDGVLAWATREQRDVLPMAAGWARQPLGVVDADGYRILTPTRSRRDAVSSPAWLFGDALLMWRDGARRGIRSAHKNGILSFIWADEPRRVHPVGGWELDTSGQTVNDYLDDAAQLYDDPNEWAARFSLDADRSEALRILFRSRVDSRDTLLQAASILAAPAALAEIAEGRLDPRTLPGYAVIEPSPFLRTVSSGILDEMMDEAGGPWFGWYRFSARHPRWRWAVTVLAIVIFTAALVLKVVQSDLGTLWIPILGLTVWGVDALIPRRACREPTE